MEARILSVLETAFHLNLYWLWWRTN